MMIYNGMQVLSSILEHWQLSGSFADNNQQIKAWSGIEHVGSWQCICTVVIVCYRRQGRVLDEVASRECKVLVVGNPCNTNALICMENALRLPRANFHALTRLDENRAKCQLALRAGRFYTSLSRVAVWGNHSTTQVWCAITLFLFPVGGTLDPMIISWTTQVPLMQNLHHRSATFDRN